MAATDEGLILLPLLTPRGGGCSIAPRGLQKADIIVSTTEARTSLAIRVGTRSLVSHTMLYAGDGRVVEAIGDGVVHRRLEEALSDATLAVAYRCPFLSEDTRRRIVAWALQKARTKVPYSKTKIGVIAAVNAGLGEKQVPIGTYRVRIRNLCAPLSQVHSEFICSELVIQAFLQAGVTLTTKPPACVSPGDVLEIAQERLTYIGHLRGDLIKLPRIEPDTPSRPRQHMGRWGE